MKFPNSPFRLDVRAVGVFRVLLALVILLDQFDRLGDWHAFHSVFGLVSLGDSRAWGNPGGEVAGQAALALDSPWVSSWLWSLYWLSDSPLLPYFLEVVRLLATFTLLLGVRSRLSAFVLFVLLASVAARNPLVYYSGDSLLVVVTFFAAFLPLAQWGSLDRLWFGPGAASSVRSAGTAAYVIQVLLVWFMAGILKTGEQWWSSGTALSMALHLEIYATEFARLWRSWDWLLQPLTFVALALECVAPLLALVPRFWCRLAGLFALVALAAGFLLGLELGLFPWIMLVALVPLFPGRFIDALARRWRTRPQAAGLVLFHDRDCRVCAFACRLLLAVCGLRGAALREAQSEPAAARILEAGGAWSVARSPGGEGGGEPSGVDPDAGFRRGWDAVRHVVQHSPRAWLLRLLPAAAERVYAWMGRNRDAWGRIGAACFGHGAGSSDRVGGLVVSLALAVVLAWNVISYPMLRDRMDLRPSVAPLISVFNLTQHWDMFAPHPYDIDKWHVMPALARDGRRVDLLSGAPVRLEPPVDGPAHYGGDRWIEVIWRSLNRGEIERVFGYHCRTGRWAAIDLWEFHRPNLGTAATAAAPYEVTRKGRWRCANVDEDAVAGFRSDIDALMAAYPSG